jgi:hypothetical protein
VASTTGQLQLSHRELLRHPSKAFESDVNIPREERCAAYSALEGRGRPMNEPSNAVSS